MPGLLGLQNPGPVLGAAMKEAMNWQLVHLHLQLPSPPLVFARSQKVFKLRPCVRVLLHNSGARAAGSAEAWPRAGGCHEGSHELAAGAPARRPGRVPGAHQSMVAATAEPTEAVIVL